MRAPRLVVPLLSVALLALPLACADGGASEDAGHDDEDHDHDEEQHVTLRFAATLGGAPFACGSDATGIGASDSVVTPLGLAFYVSEIELLDDEGHAAAFTIDDAAPFQGQGVALVDLDDGTGACTLNPAETNTDVTITGHAHGDVTGVRFTVGVPFALNHQAVDTAAAPLNVSTMWWSWNGGYKFLSVDVRTPAQERWAVHVGSTGCEPAMSNEVTSCARANRIAVELTAFDPETSTIVLDLDALLADADLDVSNMPAPGCMSSPTDDDCTGVFPKLGLSLDGSAVDAQSVFRLE